MQKSLCLGRLPLWLPWTAPVAFDRCARFPIAQATSRIGTLHPCKQSSTLVGCPPQGPNHFLGVVIRARSRGGRENDSFLGSEDQTRLVEPRGSTLRHQRHRPEQTLLYRIVAQHYRTFLEHMALQGRALPDYVQREFEDYLKCGRLEHGFLRVGCESCHAEHLVAFRCKRRGLYPSCGARRMAETAALLVDEVFPEQPVRQWVLSVPYALRFLFATRPAIMGAVLGMV